MHSPVLVIMAAGMGSRYGGLKQLDPVDSDGHVIIDYSLFDAYRAGFRKAVFIIKPELKQDFETMIGEKIRPFIDVSYAYQRLTDLPDGFVPPKDRKKPWGTGHAVLSCAELVDVPFAVINADDYYGRSAFQTIYRFLSYARDTEKCHYAMIGYRLNNTLTDFGSVSRGICEVTPTGMLSSVTERTRIEKQGQYAAYTEDDGDTWTPLPDDTIVSMNLWGFTPSIFMALRENFSLFLKDAVLQNPLKAEYFLPSVVSKMIDSKKADVTVLNSPDKWYGVTYPQDKQTVVRAIAEMVQKGLYPQHLWNSLSPEEEQ